MTYRKTVCFTLLAGMIGCLALALGVVRTQAAEKMFGTNLSFEEAADNGLPSHWGGDRNFFSADKGAGRNGTVALRQNADGEHYRLCSQKLDVTPGTRLEFSAYVRTDDPENCRPMIAVEWTAGGKWLGGSYSQKCVEEEGAESDGWTKIGNVVTVPAEADHVTLLCYVFKGGKGTAWFDDCLVKEVITSPYSAITSDHYRHVADGKDRGG
ncbi:MAG: hypothetical protein IKF77_03890, partial [Thermoguttaceae bacterium]|nr:hypothetical protein [Thermoguttaceae bacterium]